MSGGFLHRVRSSRGDASGGADTPRSGTTAGLPLGDLLAAAAGPPTPDEERGEAAALAAFRSARAAAGAGAGVPAEAVRRPSGPLASGGPAVRVAACVVALSVGGLAVAVTRAGVPVPWDGARPGVTTSGDRPGRTSGTSSGPQRVESAVPVGDTVPGHVVAGMCRFWLLAPGAGREEIERSRFAGILVDAAGGAAGIPTHCIALVGPPPDCPEASSAPGERGSAQGPAAGSEPTTAPAGGDVPVSWPQEWADADPGSW